MKIGGFLGDQIHFVSIYFQCAFYLILFQMRENRGKYRFVWRESLIYP